MKKTARRVGLPKRLERIQAEAERAINRGYRATLELLPEQPRQAVKDLRSRLGAGADELTKRGEQAFKAVEKQRRALASRVDKAIKTLQRRSERTLATVEARRAKLAASIEKGTARVVRPLAHSLDIATLSDIERLSKRLAQLERKRPSSISRAA